MTVAYGGHPGATEALAALASRRDDQDERSRERDQAPDVGPHRVLVPRFGHPRQRDVERERTDGNVHEEHPPPAERLGEDAAHERPEATAAPIVAPQTAIAPARSRP